ncbi:MAG TPA: serine protease [Methylophilaceae bacterium]|nr:serine protease [Methylophilaceae bacterium]
MNRFYLALMLAIAASVATPRAVATPLNDSAIPGQKLDQKALPIPSSRAQTLYAAARDDLLQIRVLLKNGRTQSSVGSGFLIGNSNLVVTNYHVVSQIALEPQIYFGEYVDTNGARGSVKLLAVDALHDLAIVSVGRQGTGYFNLSGQLPQLTQGQYLYSLGNPLDLGFAISEGAYNGVIGRGFYNQLMFTGPINAGMSGGPNITEDGQVAGVNVSKRLDGELVSFLVPVEYVRDLLKKVSTQTQEALTKGTTQSSDLQDFKKIVGQQLLAHQNVMIDRVLATPLSLKALGPYQVPVRESDQMRCWGRSNNRQDNPFILNNIDCAMESAVYVSDQLQIGHVAIRHEFTKATDLDAIRFSALMSASFKNEGFGSYKDINLTGPECNEHFVTNKGLPMRAVLCVRAYRKFEGLYNFSLLTATTDKSLINLQSRIDANGVSFENGMRISRIFLESIARKPAAAKSIAAKPMIPSPAVKGGKP